MKFSHTEQAAKAEKQSKWDLVEAIAADATENGLPITGVESKLAAFEAFAKAGNEQSENTIHDLAVVAKFDHDSTAGQRRTWRTYGYTAIRTVARAGLSQEAASALLAGRRLSVREIERAVRGGSPGTRVPSWPAEPDAFWGAWLGKLDALLTKAAEADDYYGDGAEVTGHGALGRLIYERITEKKIDAELRELLESEATR